MTHQNITPNTMKKTGVIIGRFQVPDLRLHPGYIFLLDAIAHSDRLIVLVGSAPVVSKRNPLQFYHIEAMFKEYNPNIEVHELKDVLGNDLWVQNVDALIDSVIDHGDESVTLYGSRDSFIPTYTTHMGKFPTVQLIEPAIFSATEVRQAIKVSKATSVDIRFGIIHATLNQFNKAFSTVDAILRRVNPVTNQAEFLVGQKASERNTNQWRFPGGFFDVGDKRSVVAASREVSEETLLDVPADSFRIVSDIEVNDWRMWGTGDSIKTVICTANIAYDEAVATNVEQAGGDDLPFIKWVPQNEMSEVLQEIHKPLWEDYQSYRLQPIRPMAVNQ